MHKLLSYILLVCAMTHFCISSPVIGDECKVHIDNRHLEMKELIGSHTKFNWNNWSHLSSIFILILLIFLLLFAYCFIKLKIWPSIKGPHATSSSAPSKTSPSVIEKPYIIRLQDIPPTTFPRPELRNDD